MSGRIRVSPPEQRTYEGIIFHSAREMNAYIGFRIIEKSGQIAKLERQVPFPLLAWSPSGPVKVSKLILDFRITETDGTQRLYESKGFVTEVYRMKKKLFEANYPDMRIVEI